MTVDKVSIAALLPGRIVSVENCTVCGTPLIKDRGCPRCALGLEPDSRAKTIGLVLCRILKFLLTQKHTKANAELHVLDFEND
jgi:hypothetical protein